MIFSRNGPKFRITVEIDSHDWAIRDGRLTMTGAGSRTEYDIETDTSHKPADAAPVPTG